ncbi:MAG TPA: 2-oxoacid:acceptor oxidoreductase family protein [Candidatus Eremiobacteraeota bacterium]|nr:MAG: indolepyruvate oxidoreductase subunit beta [bacterium ADurb.Bin363]HPZ06973.1 2-oxoacid:acceptor oxidoreductase family protein [Candidatus Eremiobacteraeota bacterium]
MEQEFIIAGLGGQGVLFLTRILSLIAQECNLPFIGSEIHGMSQRGGSVVSHFRIGNMKGPLVREGRADVIFALEESEAYRNLFFLRGGGKIYVDTGKDFPLSPFKEILLKRNVSAVTINATDMATEISSSSSANLVLLGCYIASEEQGLTREAAEKSISKIGKARVVEKNLEAFIRGFESSQLSTIRSGNKAEN